MNIPSNYHYSHIFCIGTGGTGGYLVPQIARMIYAIPNPLARPELFLIDGDTVSEKNVLRQNFPYSDIGRPKAQVMAERYSGAFGLPVKYHLNQINFNSLNVLLANNVGTNRKCLIIDCVDNKFARSEINRLVQRVNYADWMSLGNDNDSGQLIFYSRQLLRQDARTIVDVFPNLFTPEELQAEREQMNAANCAVNTISQPQTIAINHAGAMVAVNFLYQLLFDREIFNDIVVYNRRNSVNGIAIGTPFGRQARPAQVNTQQADTQPTGPQTAIHPRIPTSIADRLAALAQQRRAA